MLPKEILDTIEWSTVRQPQYGGQHCGMPNYGVKLTSKETGFEISVDAFRSQSRAREFCMIAFELFVDELQHGK